MSFNLAVILEEAAKLYPDKAVAIAGDRRMTYAELDVASSRFATALLAHCQPGDRVGVMLPNRLEFLECYFGILKAGLVMVPVNPLFKADEVRHIFTDSAVTAVVHSEAVSGVLDGDYVRFNVDAADYLGSPAPLDAAAATNADDTALIIYTSGTTGKPKGAELTHFQLYLNCTIAGETFGTRPEDVSIAVLPFFHIYGLSGILNVAIRYGSTVVSMPRFDPPAVLDAMHEHRITVMVGVPTMYHALLHTDIGDRDLSALRIGASGGASLPEAVMTAFEDKFGITILEGYGMSETGSSATMNYSVQDRRILSIGKPIWGVTAKIVGPNGVSLKPREVGEIWLRGHNIMKGYWGNPAATAEAIQDGWLRTGDLAYKDEDGYLYLVDRIKDLIIRGGYNVYPREVEEVLYGHPAIAEAAVIGRPDDRLGEEIVAVVAPKPGAVIDPEHVIAFCRERLALYKCPREVRVMQALPKTAAGKLLKRELRG
ncbi:class I adenylate-forming enzyme family protein [Catelliglobosispora koreensis]|uniref:class I adenylate-forming enzyme family protein n=1 Tax=Catelliglobosispora koreensis TaxID=129052 RepID=UPI00036EF709|nr:long-chain fatty acid--CoA ligase [Catelliglobosispora koreensis]